ncbi:MAG: hypothetical protein ACYDDZ_10960 [Acidimicrobiales bacterium]
MSKGVKYAFGAIALYLLVAYTGGAKVIGTSASGASGLVGAFQGRGKG